MELPAEVFEMLSSAEEDVRKCQNLIDMVRAQNPTDQHMQFKMDLTQSALDLRKKRIRDTKVIISKMTE